MTKDVQHKSTRAELIKAAEKIFSDHGFQNTSIRKITQAAKTNVSSINYHFQDKYGLFEAVMVNHFEEIRGEIEVAKLYQKKPREQLVLMNRMMQKNLICNAAFARMIYHVLMSRDEKLRKITKTILEQHMKPLIEPMQFASRQCRWKGDASREIPEDIFVFLIMAFNSYWALFAKELHSIFGRSSKALVEEAFGSLSKTLHLFIEEV